MKLSIRLRLVDIPGRRTRKWARREMLIFLFWYSSRWPTRLARLPWGSRICRCFSLGKQASNNGSQAFDITPISSFSNSTVFGQPRARKSGIWKSYRVAFLSVELTRNRSRLEHNCNCLRSFLDNMLGLSSDKRTRCSNSSGCLVSSFGMIFSVLIDVDQNKNTYLWNWQSGSESKVITEGWKYAIFMQVLAVELSMFVVPDTRVRHAVKGPVLAVSPTRG